MASTPPGGSSSGGITPLFAIALVVILVIVLSAFSATKKFAYWIGGIVLLAILLPAWKKTGFKVGF